MVRAFAFSASIFLLAGSALATPSDSPAQLEQHQAFQDIMDQAMAELMAPGPKQHGWDKGGVDIHQLVESAPGGIAGNYLLTVSKDGDRSITIVRGRDLGRVVPREWEARLRAGSSPDPSGADSLTVAGLDGPFYFAGWENHRRVGDSFCTSGNIGGELYESPQASAKSEMPRDMIPALFHAMATRLEKHPMCWRYDRDGDGFRISYFLEDGRTLPRLSEPGERITIVPAGPVDQLLAPPAAGK